MQSPRSLGDNYAVSEVCAEELARLGVRDIFLSPGSRSTALVLALNSHPGLTTHVHYDERGAAFAALGAGKGTGRPAVMLTTSGTALANCYPAVVEASQSRTPLILLSADRPAELRDTLAHQTIDQVKFFGGYVRWAFDILPPDTQTPIAAILSGFDQAYSRATDVPSGPVHINMQFREPLVSVGAVTTLQVPERWRESDEPFTTYHPAVMHIAEAHLQSVADIVSGARSGVMVVSTLSPLVNRQEIAALAQHLGWPLIADITSGLRGCSGLDDVLATSADLYLRISEVGQELRPEVILHLGDLPVSKHTTNWMGSSGAEIILVNDHPFRQDQTFSVTHRVALRPDVFASAIREQTSPVTSQHVTNFRALESAARPAVQAFVQRDGVSEWRVSQVIASTLPQGSGLYLSNSMPVREADACMLGMQPDILVACNRGANGIDGIIASAVGLSRATKRHVTVVIGDQAFLYDVNSLHMLRDPGTKVCVVLLNNNGGGIFHFLPTIPQLPEFEKLFGAPHQLGDLARFAAAFGVKHSVAESMNHFKQTYESAVKAEASSLIEVRTLREQTFSEFQELLQDVGQAVK